MGATRQASAIEVEDTCVARHAAPGNCCPPSDAGQCDPVALNDDGVAGPSRRHGNEPDVRGKKRNGRLAGMTLVHLHTKQFF